jgi:hypothetical protein
LVALCALLAGPSGAFAGSTTLQIRQDFSVTSTFDACGPVVAETVRTSTFANIQVGDTLDANGAPVFLHRTLIFQLDGSWTANGKALLFDAKVAVQSPRIAANGPITVTLPDGSQRAGSSYSVQGEAVNGVQLRVKLPNGQQVFIDTGRVSYDVTFVLFPDLSFVLLGQDNFAASGQHSLVEFARDCPTIQQYLS